MKPSEKPFVIPVFIPHVGCPHQCIFCNQTAVTNVKREIISPEHLRLLINGFLNYKGAHRKTVQIAFYGGNFLGINRKDMEMLLQEAAWFVHEGKADSIRFSTRPDTINDKRLDMIKDFPVATIEIGAQSMDNQVLRMAHRGHTATDTEKAAYLLRERNYELGIQMMTGLPGDDETKTLDTARGIAGLSPDFVRIYPTLVLEKSMLAQLYNSGKYSPMSLEECVTLVKKIYLLFREKKIPVIRMGLQVSEDLEKGAKILAGPYHPAFGHLVHSEIFLDMAVSSISDLGNGPYEAISIKVHPRNISEMRGLKNKNIEILKNRFQVNTIDIVPDASVSEKALHLAQCR
ncbi:elongator complex protein 3 [Desulfonema magnum]|uniref:Radical SAM domain-containing protein n=1 Tax=Desulfonema magnum TaxID=45655 RepID=A0A975GLE5_9BACT|nr:radical SAM protein [Desulfonema magnum]QTA85751.1 Radical SAM domain-containing protein [Desulfonema magnum]